ncbi:MAG TPA: HesA/MoeB/ThiF family protein [Steroidobacteraceae bacterium]
MPIWKKERYENGDSGWVNCERCAAPAEHTHDHGNSGAEGHAHEHHGHDHAGHPGTTSPEGHAHEHRGHDHAGHPGTTSPEGHAHEHHGHDHASHQHAGQAHTPKLIPDYSRQMALKEVGAGGQAKLRASRILVIGCGGLGVPVIGYLAGAGVGRLGLVDSDRLEPSNLHRQTMYALSDVGQLKSELAVVRARALNPDVEARAHSLRLNAGNAENLVSQYDLVIDCTDNFSTKFMLNDVCVRLGKPVIFSSVYQYEGQVQVVRPERASTCLRCVWPEATRDGVVGNCSEAGVLGPVPGVFGTLQALEALKILLNLPGQLGDEMLVLDLLTMSISRVRTRRAADCPDHAKRTVSGPEVATDAPEVEFDTLDDAVTAGFELVDIRESHELAETPAPSRNIRHVPMAELLYGKAFTPTRKTLLVCASGKRSLASAEELRARGVAEVYSLRGGVHGLLRSVV